jgi:ribosomal protein L11 methyltransferase
MRWGLAVVVKEENWRALDVTIEAPAQEAVEYALMEAGAAGTEYDESSAELPQVIAYFNSEPQRELIREKLFEALHIYNLPTSSVRDMSIRDVENADWLEKWKESWQPVEVGNRFVVAPPWSEIPKHQDKVVIRIEPGMAFGTGTHETTRLCLSAIEKYFDGSSFLDVGTGTGVLAIAAAKLFPDAVVTAYDTDADAIEIARDNARQNNVPNVEFHVGTIDETISSANLVCANLTAPVILGLLPILIGATCGRLVLSGVLDTQLELIEAGLQKLGINDFDVEHEGEWVAIIV